MEASTRNFSHPAKAIAGRDGHERLHFFRDPSILDGHR